MKLEQLFKRYLKEIGVYGSNEGKLCIEFMREFTEPYIPFNSFRWDTSEQGSLFWFERAVNWLIFLYNNFDNVELDGFEAIENLNEKGIANEITYVLAYFRPTEVENISMFAFFKDVNDILDKNGIKIDEYQ